MPEQLTGIAAHILDLFLGRVISWPQVSWLSRVSLSHISVAYTKHQT